MAKFLFEARYTAEGAKGLAHDGGTVRRAAVTKMLAAAGGKLEAFYFALGEIDCYVIAELPDATTAAAAAIAINQSGAVTLRTVALISPEEMDTATKKSVAYDAPG